MATSEATNDIETLVTSRLRNRDTNITAVTLRIADGELLSIDEIASELNLTRQDVLAQFVSYGIKKAQEMIKKHDTQGVELDDSTNSHPNYYLLNTNTKHNMASHHDMLKNGLAAAFWGDWKLNINKLKKGDRVFLYQNGVGIVGTGIATGNTVISDIESDDGCMYPEKYSQKLDNFLKDFQISLKSCNTITKSNLSVLRTMSRIKEEQGIALLQEIERLKNQHTASS
ncbi:MAG: hypothetical protein WAT29_02555 [Thiolinea sp.]